VMFLCGSVMFLRGSVMFLRGSVMFLRVQIWLPIEGKIIGMIGSTVSLCLVDVLIVIATVFVCFGVCCVYRQMVIQHCRTSDLELTVTCSVKLRLSHYFQIQA